MNRIFLFFLAVLCISFLIGSGVITHLIKKLLDQKPTYVCEVWRMTHNSEDRVIDDHEVVSFPEVPDVTFEFYGKEKPEVIGPLELEGLDSKKMIPIDTVSLVSERYFYSYYESNNEKINAVNAVIVVICQPVN